MSCLVIYFTPQFFDGNIGLLKRGQERSLPGSCLVRAVLLSKAPAMSTALGKRTAAITPQPSIRMRIPIVILTASCNSYLSCK